MKNSLVTKSLSITLSATLLATSFSGIAGAGMAPAAAAMPDFVRTLTPPETLGFVDTYYQGNSEKPVILIQDLHANVGVQKKIEGLLNFYQPKVTEGGKPMVMGVEGAWGKMNLDHIRALTLKVRKGASDFLLKEAEISGMDHFAVMSKAAVDYFGIDDPEDYILHVNLFQKSLAARLQLAAKVDKLRIAVNNAKADGTSSMRQLWKIADQFHNGQMSLEDLSKALNVSVKNYGQAEAALTQAQQLTASSDNGDKAFKMQNIVIADRSLELLSRLFRQQLTLEEVEYVSKQIPQMLTVVQALLPRENMTLWKDTIQSAIDHYAVALLRNKPMAQHAEDLANQYPHSNTVIVTGGFHTASIADHLKSKKISYVVIAPVVESQTAHDEALYLKRMMGIHVTNQEIAAAARAVASGMSVTPKSPIRYAAQVAAGTVAPNSDPALGRVLDETLRAMQTGVQPSIPVSQEEEKAAAAIEAATEGVPSVNSPSFFDSWLSRGRQLISKLKGDDGKPENQITMDEKPSTSEKQTLLGKEEGSSTPKAATSIAVAAVVLVSVNIARAANHPAVDKVVDVVKNSTSLEQVLAGSLIALGAAFAHPKSRKVILNGLDAAKQAIVNSQA